MVTYTGRGLVKDEDGGRKVIAYAAQTPWLGNQCIKDNVLFGYQLNEGRYQAGEDACALNPDLKALEDEGCLRAYEDYM